MSSKLGIILSSIFIIMSFLFATDLISLQFIYSDLDAKSINVSYLISRSAMIDENFHKNIETKFNVDFICQKYGAPAFGEEIYYSISSTFDPLFMSSESMTVSVSRMAIVGYYG